MKKLLTTILTTALLASPFAVTSAAEETASAEAAVTFYRDAALTDPYEDTADIAAGDRVYYSITCDPGYYCYAFQVNGTDIDTASFTAAEAVTEYEVFCHLMGNIDGKIGLSLSDASWILQYIAGYGHNRLMIEQSRDGERMIDFNCDGKINLSDVAGILRVIAGHEGVQPQSGPESDFVTVSLSDMPVTSFVIGDRNTVGNIDDLSEHNRYYPTVTDTTEMDRLFSQIIGMYDLLCTYDRESDTLTESGIDLSVYNDAFFEKNGLTVFIARADVNKALCMDALWMDSNGNMHAEFSAYDSEATLPTDDDRAFMSYWVYIIETPKDFEGSTYIVAQNSADTVYFS